MNSAEQPGISVDVDHNPYLAEGSGTVDAIVSITVSRDVAAAAAPTERVEAIIIDCSTSMLKPAGKFDAAKRATAAAIDELSDGTHFIIVAGTGRRPSARLSRRGRADAGERDDQGGGGAGGGRAAAQRWHRDGHLAGLRPRHRRALPRCPHPRDPAHRRQGRARDGRTAAPRNRAQSVGRFTCDCRGVGTAWRVDELRAISSALMGTVDIVADPRGLRGRLRRDDADLDGQVDSRADPAAVDSGGCPTVEFVKQVAPTVEDLTGRRVDTGTQIGEYPLGSWGAEDRDYHVQVTVEPAAAGKEKLAARVTVVAGVEVLGQGLVTAVWTADTALSARISRRVAHYTGQAELAQAVQDGLGRTPGRGRGHRDGETAARDGDSPLSRVTTTRWWSSARSSTLTSGPERHG